jgi:hypothetical protein
MPNCLVYKAYDEDVNASFASQVYDFSTNCLLNAALGRYGFCALATIGTWPRAIDKVRRDAQREWRGIDQIVRREMPAELPATIDDLIRQLEGPGSEPDIGGWAEALTATHDCAICGTKIVDPLAFPDAAFKHYDTADDDGDLSERIEVAIRRSSNETGGWGDGSLCAYHNEQAAKDD